MSAFRDRGCLLWAPTRPPDFSKAAVRSNRAEAPRRCEAFPSHLDSGCSRATKNRQVPRSSQSGAHLLADRGMARDVGRKPEIGQFVACDGESATALGSNRGWFSRQATAVVAAPRGERVALRQTAGGFHHRHMQRILPNLAVRAMKPDRRVVRLREVLHTRQSSGAYTARRGPCAIRRCPSECRGIQPKVDSWHAMKVRL